MIEKLEFLWKFYVILPLWFALLLLGIGVLVLVVGRLPARYAEPLQKLSDLMTKER